MKINGPTYLVNRGTGALTQCPVVPFQLVRLCRPRITSHRIDKDVDVVFLATFDERGIQYVVAVTGQQNSAMVERGNSRVCHEFDDLAVQPCVQSILLDVHRLSGLQLDQVHEEAGGGLACGLTIVSEHTTPR